MGKRRQGRIMALQIMYQRDAGPGPLEEILTGFWEENSTADDTVRHFTDELVRGTVAHIDSLNELIEDYASHWSTGRLAVIDRNILRLAMFELLYREDIPPKVSINEYVDIAKKFSTEESGAFVNGILDRTLRETTAGSEGKGGGG